MADSFGVGIAHPSGRFFIEQGNERIVLSQEEARSLKKFLMLNYSSPEEKLKDIITKMDGEE